MILFLSGVDKLAVEELEESLLDQGRVRRIAAGEAAAFKLFHGHFWYLAYNGERMMWYPLNGNEPPQRVER